MTPPKVICVIIHHQFHLSMDIDSCSMCNSVRNVSFNRNSQVYFPYKGCSGLKVKVAMMMVFIVFHFTSAFMMILIEDLEKVWAGLALDLSVPTTTTIERVFRFFSILFMITIDFFLVFYHKWDLPFPDFPIKRLSLLTIVSISVCLYSVACQAFLIFQFTQFSYFSRVFFFQFFTWRRSGRLSRL